MSLHCPHCQSSNLKQSHLNRRGYVCQNCFGGFMLGISFDENKKEKEGMKDLLVKNGCCSVRFYAAGDGVTAVGHCEEDSERYITVPFKPQQVQALVEWLSQVIKESQRQSMPPLGGKPYPPGAFPPHLCPVCKDAGYYYVEKSNGFWYAKNCPICEGRGIQSGDRIYGREDC